VKREYVIFGALALFLYLTRKAPSPVPLQVRGIPPAPRR